MSLHVTIIFLSIGCNIGPDFREESKSSQCMHGLLVTMTKDMSAQPCGFWVVLLGVINDENNWLSICLRVWRWEQIVFWIVTSGHSLVSSLRVWSFVVFEYLGWPTNLKCGLVLHEWRIEVLPLEVVWSLNWTLRNYHGLRKVTKGREGLKLCYGQMRNHYMCASRDIQPKLIDTIG